MSRLLVTRDGSFQNPGPSARRKALDDDSFFLKDETKTFPPSVLHAIKMINKRSRGETALVPSPECRLKTSDVLFVSFGTLPAELPGPR